MMNAMRIVRRGWKEIWRQPVIGAVTLGGTALTIFLIMTVVTLNDINVVEFAPESNRGRMLHAPHMHLNNIDNNGSSSGAISYGAARKMYAGLESAEAVSVYTSSSDVTAGVSGGVHVETDLRETDGEFWKVFDFTFVSGNAYGEGDVEGNVRRAVISESVAREVFGSVDVTGRELMIDNFTPYSVAGVVKDVPMAARMAYAGIWIPLTQEVRDEDWSKTGSTHVTILAHDKGDFDEIRGEIARRREAFNSELKAVGKEIVNHGQPYTQDLIQYAVWSNVGPEEEAKEGRQTFWLTCVILLLIPAINLSSMTHSRLRQRVSEMGVRRAFGCTKWQIVTTIVNENLIMTAIGGLIGLVMSVGMIWLMGDLLLGNMDVAGGSANVSVGMLMQWRTLWYAVGFCFVLNLLSSGIPAFQAARVKPTEAIGGVHK